MHSQPCVTIDAGVLAAPHLTSNASDVHRYVETLLDWSKLLDEPWVAIHISERAPRALVEDGLYPLRTQLKELFNEHGVVEYDVNTVARIAEQLLRVTPSFETYYRVKDVLSDQLETLPDVLRLTTHDGLQSDLARCILLIAILRKHCSQPPGGHSLILREAPKQVIHVRAQVLYLEHDRDDISTLPSPPEFFEGDVLACDDFRGLIECLDEAAILVGASDNPGIELAIRIALYKDSIAQGESPDWSSAMNSRIGAKFRESCQQCCADQGDALPPKILRSIVETINRQNLSAVHALRTGPGANDPQQMRDKDKAIRRDIDREFHLHYWDCEDGTIELASVAYHNDFSIPRQ